MAENTLPTASIGEEAIPTIVEDTAITTEDNGIVIYASKFSQGDEKSTTTTTLFNFDDTDRPKSTAGEIKKQQSKTQAVGSLKHI